MTKNSILSLIRHLLSIAGGVAVAKGVMSDSTAVEVVGAASAIIGTVWGAKDEHTNDKKVQAGTIIDNS